MTSLSIYTGCREISPNFIEHFAEANNFNYMTYFACVPSCYSMSLGCCFSHGGYDSLDAGRRSGIVLLVIVIKWQWDNWLLCFWLYYRLVFLMPQIAPENEEICSWKWLKENVRYCLSATLAVIITSALLSFHIWTLLLRVKICSCQLPRKNLELQRLKFSLDIHKN